MAFQILSSSPSPSSDGKRASSTIPLLATHRARYVRTSSGEFSLGPGPFVSALEVGVGNGLKAECIGKPERTFFEVCLDDLGIERGYTDGEGASIGMNRVVEAVAVVGDDTEADLAGGAIELGLCRVLGSDSFMV
jgi:ribonucleotide monophosphatase NagD (HAD superfamily)